MSKRSRREFDAATPSFKMGEKPLKRSRKNSEKSAADSENELEYECPVCYEDFAGKIFQCQEGHLLCESCYPKFEECPTCRISLSPHIRNRILEKILASKPSTEPKHRESRSNSVCPLCRRAFASASALDAHLNECEQRVIECPFDDCKWNEAFSLFADHAKDAHHTAHGSKQPAPDDDQNNVYHFNHAIKFPKDTFSRESSDFVWPKIVRFRDGRDFFVLSRYRADCITVFVRLMTLPKLSREEKTKLKAAMDTPSQLQLGRPEEEVLGKYFIEFRMKEKSGNHNRNKKKKENGYDSVPLRWPADLYGVTLPFKGEQKGQVLKVHRSVFTRYWSQESVGTSAVLRFQFRALFS